MRLSVQRVVHAVRWGPQRLLIAGVRFYRFFLSPWLGSQCRFTPTCSAYAVEALIQHGAVRGGYLAACRLCRCRPGACGGHDPVPGRRAGSPCHFSPVSHSDSLRS